ncbi:winged helix-turn-helix transcriptional regulator [Candidatus Peribacteria bacterium]|nr:winged helix-turn-helix transcriptional regulator [Candidatus Peribacteria bacterium]
MIDVKKLQNTIFPQEKLIRNASEVFQLLGNECRLEMLIALVKAGELSSGEIAEVTNCSPSVVSQALSQMKKLRLVTTRREWLNIYYKIDESHELWDQIWKILKPHFKK